MSAIDQGGVVAVARAALQSYAWSDAYEVLAGELESGSPEALELLGEAAWWTARLDTCIEARRRAYTAREQEGNELAAGVLAALLYDNCCFQGRRSVANAWLARARRLLASAPEGLECALLLIREAEEAHGQGDLDGAAEFARRALATGRAMRLPDIEADALQCLGRVLITARESDAGLACFDEAMLMVTEGRVSAFVSGKVYCSLVTACEELGDVRRAAEWTAVGAEWAASHPVSVFPGLCRVHRAEMLARRGELHDAERQARQACAELEGVNVFNTALGFREVGDILRRLGDLDGAEQAFQRASDLGVMPQPGLALLRLAEGKAAAAAGMVAQALHEEAWNPLARAKLLPAAVQIAVAVGDVMTAKEAMAELDDIASTYRTSGLLAAAAVARGRVHLADGDPRAAVVALRQAVRDWQDLESPYEEATARVLLGTALREADDEEGAAACFASASAIFERLGAAPDLVWAREIQRGAKPIPGGLSARELDVLRLVASGATNRQVAGELFISEKTVDRHLSNIFRKLGVSSRAAATAFAVERGLTTKAGM